MQRNERELILPAMNYLFALLFCMSVSLLPAQAAHIHAYATCHGNKIETGDTLPGGIALQTARFYLSDFIFINQGKEIFREKNSYHLVDLEFPESGDWTIHSSGFDEISFLLGTDSLTNVSGVYGGDLDPVKGMYWTWNSGYINVKLEGFSPHSKGRNGAFGLHLGGYMPPFQTDYRVQSGVAYSEHIHIELDVCPMFEQADWNNHFNVMSPSAEAARLTELLGKSIRVYAE
jgi:hypothetical protein